MAAPVPLDAVPGDILNPDGIPHALFVVVMRENSLQLISPKGRRAHLDALFKELPVEVATLAIFVPADERDAWVSRQRDGDHSAQVAALGERLKKPC